MPAQSTKDYYGKLLSSHTNKYSLRCRRKGGRGRDRLGKRGEEGYGTTTYPDKEGRFQ